MISRALSFERSTPRLLPPDTEDNLQQLFIENRWTDFLPVVLPTEERVAAMLKGTSQPPDKVVGRMRPDAISRILGVHGREGGGQRGDGGRAAGIFPGDPGAGGERPDRALEQHHVVRRPSPSSTVRSATRSA